MDDAATRLPETNTILSTSWRQELIHLTIYILTQHTAVMGKYKSSFDLNHDRITGDDLNTKDLIWKRVIWFDFILCDLIWIWTNHNFQ